MNNMKSYSLTFLLDRPLLKNVVQIHGEGKTRCFYENLGKKVWALLKKVTTYFETKTHKRDLIYTWDLETALKYEDVLFILLK